ncbi:MAG: hypothetical protein NFW16_11560 [Candidatus Accumulibacter sp.]|uniref:hypothetical protein n=1 Tax=Accumulibacter sp. TaxID=2053492 RepID=UPI0025898404|nr:hypothetical protein [Accumulibacter sp.]MCM8622342.1 hypothetical protein [Accumulibacter sp.]
MDNGINRVNRELNTFDVEFGKRLREERERRGLNQSDFGALGGVAKVAQLNYEKGYRVPSTHYLSNLRKHGVDVGYLLSGDRDMPVMGRLDAKLLSCAISAVQEAAKQGGYVFSGIEEATMILAVHDAMLAGRNAGQTAEQFASAILTGWSIGRSGGV